MERGSSQSRVMMIHPKESLRGGVDNMEESLFCTLLQTRVWREVVFYSLGVVSLGVIPIVLGHFPALACRFRYKRCEDPLTAKYFLVHGAPPNKSVVLMGHPIKVAEREYILALPHQSYSNPLGEGKEMIETVVFDYLCRRFIYHLRYGVFVPATFDIVPNLPRVHQRWGRGVAEDETRRWRQMLFGLAEMVIPVDSWFTLLKKEIFHAFFVFQVFAIALWIWDEYYQYAGAVVIISCALLMTEMFFIRKTQQKLRQMIPFHEACAVLCGSRTTLGVLNPEAVKGCNTCAVRGQFQEILTKELVPGDIVKLEPSMILMSDMLLLQGYAFMNENILTGETVPVLKSPVPYNPLTQFSLDSCYEFPETSMLYAGSTVINVRNPGRPWVEVFHTQHKVPLALVLRTGFSTRQGQMLRSILHPPDHERLTFKDETLKLLLFLSFMTTLGALGTLLTTWSKGVSWDVILIRSLDTFTNGIPPSLSTIMVAGCALAVLKLKIRFHIYCLDPSRINMAGQVNTVVFDKTGTLTNDTLQLCGFLVPSQLWLSHQEEEKHDAIKHPFSENFRFYTQEFSKTLPRLLQYALATCHSVVCVNDRLCGDPMEVSMVQSVPCVLVNPPERNTCCTDLPGIHTEASAPLDINQDDDGLPCITLISFHSFPKEKETQKHTTLLQVVKVFEFSSALQRMSVVVWDKRAECLYVFLKGSPEQVYQRCNKASLSPDYQKVLKRYTSEGHRVLSFAFKSIGAHLVQHSEEAILEFLNDLTRPEVESDLTFLGFILFTNPLQKGTVQCLQELQKSECRCLMATGDNSQTALAVAKNTGLIPRDNAMTFMGDMVIVSHVALPYSAPKELRWFVCSTSSLPSSTSGSPEPLTCAGEKDTSDPNTTGYTTRKLQTLLYGQDPRRLTFLLTGEAFTYLKEQHEKFLLQSASSQTLTPSYSPFLPCSRFIQTTFPSWILNNVATFLPSPISPHPGYLDSSTTKQGLPPLVTYDSKKDDSSTTISLQPSKQDEVFYLEIHTASHNRGDQEQCVPYFAQHPVRHDDTVPNKTVLTAQHTDTSTQCTLGDADCRISYLALSWFEFFLRFTRVYARMSPDDKFSLVTCLRSLSFSPVVAMCGDSSNDALALKGADVGFSLSDTEASIAAPFTSQTKDVSLMVHLLREARATLVNSFQCFKFITLYAMLQLFATLVLYNIGTNLTDSQYVWIDLCVVLPLALAMACTDAASTLSSRLPLRRVISLPVLLSLFLQISLHIIALSFALVTLRNSPFFVPFQINTNISRFLDSDLSSMENTVIFLVYHMENLTLATVMAMGQPWRQSITTNFVLMILLTSLFLLGACLIVFPQRISFLNSWLHLVPIPSTFRYFLLALVVLDFLLSYVIEHYIVNLVTRRQEKKERLAFQIDHVIPLHTSHKVCFSSLNVKT